MSSSSSSPRRRSALLWCTAGLAIAACSSASDGDSTGTTTQPAQTTDTVDAPPSESTVPEPADTEPGSETTVPPDPARGVNAEIAAVANENNTLSAIVSITGDDAFAVELSAESGDHRIEVPRTAGLAGSHDLPLVGMRSEREYVITAQLTNAVGDIVDTLDTTFVSGAVPERFAAFEFSADPERSSPGFTIVEMQHWKEPQFITPQRPFDESGYLIAIDETGEIVWYYENGPVVQAVEQTAAGTFTSIYWPTGAREFDMLGNEIGDWQVPIENANGPAASSALRKQEPAEPTGVDALEPLFVDSDDLVLELVHHEATQMPNGNYLLLSTTDHDITPEQQAALCPDDVEPFGVLSDVAVEYEPDGRVVRTWDLWDAVDAVANPGREMCNAFFAVDGHRDWAHANAVIYDEARDAVIFSARHTSQVVAMKRSVAEGPQTELLWSFGENGTVPVDGDIPQYQHAVEVQDDGSILLYDNGNGRAGTARNDPDNPTYSRAVLYDVDDSSSDPADWTVTQLWEHRMDDTDGEALFAPFIGDADRLSNGNVLITHGGIGFMDPDDFVHTTIVEVVPDGASGGDIVWEFRVGAPDLFSPVYRSERIESFYVGPEWVTD